ncbi:cysteine desulfurase family protein [Paenibacillus sp. 481]|uniref:cysteine desulfurase family protein n=1 Tax=Paenibacillus sp. 481 TaxID=2835869 RepID=UPI001E43CF76|nr:cysteine desulfurase family protein [Paenibacillus sp. 481]UHA74150.1 cysteine desulfurase [Paenibacillus sp. 481]
MNELNLYFDHSASTPPHPDVIRTMAEVMERVYANPSSIHQVGGHAEQMIRRAREVIAQALTVQPSDVIFTSGATESNNLAVLGVARAQLALGKSVHMITSHLEHASVFESYKQLEREGVSVTYVPVDSNGRVQPEQIERALRPDTIMVSVMHVNNETGAIQPLEEIGQILRQRSNAYFHVDGVQGLGKIAVALERWNAHLYSISGHKINGPKGVGALIRRGQVRMQPLFFGGLQEQQVRPGTENVPAIVAFAKAVRLAVEGQSERYEQLVRLREQVVAALRDESAFQVLKLNSPELPLSAPHIINVSYPGMKSEVVVHSLEQHGIVVSTQSACSSKLHKPSRVLLAMTNDAGRASSGLRISLAANHTERDISQLISALQQTVAQLQPLMQRR